MKYAPKGPWGSLETETVFHSHMLAYSQAKILTAYVVDLKDWANTLRVSFEEPAESDATLVEKLVRCEEYLLPAFSEPSHDLRSLILYRVDSHNGLVYRDSLVYVGDVYAGNEENPLSENWQTIDIEPIIKAEHEIAQLGLKATNQSGSALI